MREISKKSRATGDDFWHSAAFHLNRAYSDLEEILDDTE